MSESLIVLKTAEEIDALIEYISNPELQLVAFDTETTGLSHSAQIVGLSVCAEDSQAYYVVTREWQFDKILSQKCCETCDNTGVTNVRKSKKLPVVTQQCPTCGGTGSVEHAEFTNCRLTTLPNEDKIKQLLEILKTKALIMQNATVDIVWTKNNYGVDLRESLYFETMAAAHLINENRRVGLKELGRSEFGEEALTEQAEMKASVIANGGTWEDKRGGEKSMYKADPYILGKYGAKDALLTYKLCLRFSEQLEEQGLIDFYFTESMPLARGPIYDLNTVGLKCDVDGFRKLQKDLEDECAMLQSQIEQELAPYVTKEYPKGFGKKFNQFNIGSGQQLAWLLFKKLGQPWTKLTDAGRDLAKNLLGRAPYNASGRKAFERAVSEAINAKGSPLKIERYLSTGVAVLAKMQFKYKWVDYLMRYKKALKLLNTYAIGIQEKIEYGIIRPSFLQCGTTGNRLSSRGPNFQNLPRDDKRVKSLIIARPGKVFVGADFCLPAHTEYLTPNGWKVIEDLTADTPVWQVDRGTLGGSFVLPSRIVKRDYEGPMHRFSSYRGAIEATENHRMLWVGQQSHKRADKGNYRKDSLAQDGIPNQACSLACFSTSDSQTRFSTKEIWLTAMTQADASYMENGDYRIEVSYPRKREKISELLGQAGNVQKLRDCHTMPVERWRYAFSSSLLLTGREKHFDLTALGANQASILVEALLFWDGSRSRTNTVRGSYCTTSKHNADQVQAYLCRSGYEATIYTSKMYKPQHSQAYIVSIKKKGTIRFGGFGHSLSKIKVESHTYTGIVGCVTVPTGYILVRQHGLAFVTGNCQIEPRVFASLSGDVRLLDCFASGKDFYSVIGIDIFGAYDCTPYKSGAGSFGEKWPLLRQVAKETCLAATYGITAFKLTDVLNLKAPRKDSGPWEIDEVKGIIDRYFEAYPAVEDMRRKYHRLAIDNGVVFNLYGRPRHIPAARAIKSFGSQDAEDLPYEYRSLLNNAVNFPCQGSAGSIINRAAIMFYATCRKREQADPRWAEVRIVAQVHDELIAEGPESLGEEISFELQTSMETACSLPGVALTAKPKIGRTFAEIK